MIACVCKCGSRLRFVSCKKSAATKFLVSTMLFSWVSRERVEAKDSISIMVFSTAFLCASNTSLLSCINAKSDTDFGAENV